MKKRTVKKTTTNVGKEGKLKERLNDQGMVIAKAQLAWLILLANNVVEDLKAPIALSTTTIKETIVKAKRERNRP